MAVDLHTHSNRSDGTDPPREVVERAARVGLSAVALTDHDTLAGVPEAMAAASREGVEVVPGIEISCEWEPGTMHMLVLFLEPGREPFHSMLDELARWRETRNQQLIERLQSLRLDITLDEVEAEAGAGSMGRPHVAAVMVGKGLVPDLGAAFDLYLAKGRPGYVGRRRLGPEEAIGLARDSGAVPVLAHPHTLGLEPGSLEDLLERLQEAGLVGLESHYSDYPLEQRLRWAERARRRGLIPSGGSDYHGRYKPWLELGSGQGDLLVPDEVLEELRRAGQALADRR